MPWRICSTGRFNPSIGIGGFQTGAPFAAHPRSDKFQSLNRDRGLSNERPMSRRRMRDLFQSLNRDRGLSNFIFHQFIERAGIGFNPSIGIGGFQTCSGEMNKSYPQCGFNPSIGIGGFQTWWNSPAGCPRSAVSIPQSG